MHTFYVLVRRLKGLPDGRLMTLDGRNEGWGHGTGIGNGGLVVYGDGDVGNGGGSNFSLSFRDGFNVYGDVSGSGFGFGYGYLRGGGESE